jgi:hypothetical protein
MGTRRAPRLECVKPWERQAGESTKAFEAAHTYFEIGPRRSIDQLLDGNRYKTRSTLGAWSAKYGWVERSEAFDDFIADKAAKEYASNRVKEAERLGKKHAQQQEAAQMVFMQPTEAMLRRLKNNPDGLRAEFDALPAVTLTEMA